MKILHVIPSVDPATGGPVEGLKQLCHVYNMGGHEVEVASLDSPHLVEQLPFPARVFALGPGWGLFGYSPRAARWFKENLARYDVVFINCIWQYNTLAAYRALTGKATPYAVFTHGMLDPYFKKRFPLKHIKKLIYWRLFLRKILHNATTVLFTCEEEKILARQSFPGYEVRETVVPYGTFGPPCDTAEAGEEFLTQWPLLRGKRLAISMGRIHPKKGTDLLIEAFAATVAGYPSWHLVIAGPDQIGTQRSLEALAVRLGIADRITWTGMLTATMKWGALAASEVFVLPSHQENFGIVVAEAMACGLPVIVSNKVNIWREVENYKAGLICDDTVEGVRTSMTRWQSLTGKEIATLQRQSKKCFDELFDYEVTAQKALDIVEYVAHQAGGK
ncbi:MAG TPA: glycosyltransferase [Terracidiphilus sp.]|jgi:glycosyltransferase involved in cell wall biosynthesis